VAEQLRDDRYAYSSTSMMDGDYGEVVVIRHEGICWDEQSSAHRSVQQMQAIGLTRSAITGD
jgi:hypothetical protein